MPQQNYLVRLSLAISIASVLGCILGCKYAERDSIGISTEIDSSPTNPTTPIEVPFPTPESVTEIELFTDRDQSPLNQEPSTISQTIVEKVKKETMSKPSLDELLLFFPSKYPDGDWEPKDLVFEDVWFTSEDGTRIHGWYCPSKKPRAVVLYAHGNAGNLSHRAPVMSHLQNGLGVTALIFDYRGYGQSEGRATVAGVISDTRAASKFLAERAGVKETDLILMGRSVGGAIVVQVAIKTQPRGLILESTFSSLKQVAAHHYPKLAWLVPSAKLDSKTAISDFHGRLLQSHGTNDRTIPYDSGVELFEAANEPKQFIEIPNADHNDPLPSSYSHVLDEYFDSSSF